MIFDLITFVATVVFWCLGFYTITQQGNIGYFIRKPFDMIKNYDGEGNRIYKIPRWISDPLATCITCVSSVHGILIFVLLNFLKAIEFNLWVLLLGCVMASFIQTFIWVSFECLLEKTNYYKKKSNGL